MIVLVCYLDDSGKDPQNPITTVAGYIAREDAWQDFEAEVEPHFAERKVSILHAKELHDTDGDFKGWTRLQKQAFVARLSQVLGHHLLMGLSMSALKGSYEEHAGYRASGTPRVVRLRPIRFAFRSSLIGFCGISGSGVPPILRAWRLSWNTVTKIIRRLNKNWGTFANITAFRMYCDQSPLFQKTIAVPFKLPTYWRFTPAGMGLAC
jgi:hypothetical protein